MSTGQLPKFPDFVALSHKHQTAIDKIVAKFEPYSDYNFISLWSWDHQNKLKLCTLNGNLVVRFQDYADPRDFFYSFLGNAQIDKTIDTLLELSSGEGQSQLKLIPESVAKAIKNRDKYTIKEDRDSFDYIVAVKDAQNLDTKNLRQFLKRHPQKMVVKELDILDDKHKKQMRKLVKIWQKQMVGHSSYNKSEISALARIFNEHHKIKTEKLHIVGIYLSDELRGFAINEILEGGFAMGHYKKTDRQHRGLDEALVKYISTELYKRGLTHLNYEQDLGLEGLREAKTSYRPISFLKKYTLSLRKNKS